MRSDLTKLFARRLQQEMKRHQPEFSGNALAKAAGVGQRSVARILLPDGDPNQQTPSLDIVSALANALGVPAWFLLMERDQVEERIIRPPLAAQRGAVYNLPAPYPPVFPPPKRTRKPRSVRKK